MAALGFRCIAPDMRGYGRSSTYKRHEDFAQELIVEDMLELLASLGRDKAVWIGHDWGSPVVWNMASHHPDRTAGVASLCVPYLAAGFTLETVVSLVDRKVYPEAEFPAGQWDYQFFYEESFDKACKGFESNIRNVVKALFRKGDPKAVGKPSRTASVRRNGGWFGGAAFPDVPRDPDVITEQDMEAYTAALTRNGFFGPDSWYMNHKANGAYAKRAQNGGKLVDARAVPARRLRHDLRDDALAARRADAAGLQRSHRGRGELRPLDGAGTAGGRQCRAGEMAGDEAARLLEGLVMRPVLIALLLIASLAPVPSALAQNTKPPAKPAAPATQDSPLPTLSMVVPERDRNAVYAYYREEVAAGRCPAGLVKKNNACGAPAPAKQAWKLDQPLPDGVAGEALPAALIAKLSPSPAGHQYLRVDNDILIVSLGARNVAALVADLSRL